MSSDQKTVADIYTKQIENRLNLLETLFSGFIAKQSSVAVYVDLNGSDDEANQGSAASPFKTIPRAVKELQKYRAGAETNFIVNINPGTYVFQNPTEPTLKDRISLFHIDATESFPLLIRQTPNTTGSVTFRWDVTDAQFSAFYLFRVLSPTRFENINFVCNDTTNSHNPYPCFISTANGLGLYNCNFTNVTGIAISISGGKISMIRNCTFTGCYDADNDVGSNLDRWLSPYCIILSGCKEGIRNVTISGFNTAIELRDGSSLTNDVFKATATTLEPNTMTISGCKYCLRAFGSSGLMNFHPSKMAAYNDSNITNRDAVTITLNEIDFIAEYLNPSLTPAQLEHLFYLDNTSWERN